MTSFPSAIPKPRGAQDAPYPHVRLPNIQCMTIIIIIIIINNIIIIIPTTTTTTSIIIFLFFYFLILLLLLLLLLLMLLLLLLLLFFYLIYRLILVSIQIGNLRYKYIQSNTLLRSKQDSSCLNKLCGISLYLIFMYTNFSPYVSLTDCNNLLRFLRD